MCVDASLTHSSNNYTAYTCIHVHTFVYTYIYIHIYIYTYKYTHAHTYMYTCICIYIYTYTHIYICIYLHMSCFAGRLEVGSLKPAPVSVNYLGFPYTLTIPGFDYILADRIVLPPGDMTRSYV